jgi:hypothetical protein
MTEASTSSPSLQRIALVAATLCFLVGWFHVGQGLRAYNFLGSQYGAWVFATIILLIMIISYDRAVKGSTSGFLFYLMCALVTFIGNLNSFYPSYRAGELIREELQTHRTQTGVLREQIGKVFSDPQLESFKRDVENQIAQLDKQLTDGGLGEQSKRVIATLEDRLETKVTLLGGRTYPQNPEGWARLGSDYRGFFEQALTVYLTKRNYGLDIDSLIRDSRTFADDFSKQIDSRLKSNEPLTAVPKFVDQIVKTYIDLCTRATQLQSTRPKQTGGVPTEDSAEAPICDANYKSTNSNLGKFTHTFSSAWKTLSSGDTLTVLFVCLVLDFGIPLALYFLVRRRRDDRIGIGVFGTKTTNSTNKSVRF